jgi:hypothetical protein
VVEEYHRGSIVEVGRIDGTKKKRRRRIEEGYEGCFYERYPANRMEGGINWKKGPID